MTLGHFGGVSSKLPVRAGGGGAPQGDLMDESIRRQLPSPEGMPALSHQLAQALASYGINLLINGSKESWSAGTTSAPDGYTLSGAGATIARNTTSGQIQDGLASCNVTAALNTVTRLSQTLSISATQNTRFRSQQVVYSERVLASSAARVSLELDDWVLVTTSPIQHTGSGAFETLTVTITVDSAATQLKASLLISSGASITVTTDASKLEEGATATSFSPHPNDAFVQPRVLVQTDQQTTTSTALTSLSPAMSLANVIVDGSQSVFIIAQIQTSNNTASTVSAFRLRRDTTELGAQLDHFITNAGTQSGVTLAVFDSKPAAGNYTYELRWFTNTGTMTSHPRVLTVVIVPSA